MRSPKRTRIVVVGAGPAGIMLAYSYPHSYSLFPIPILILIPHSLSPFPIPHSHPPSHLARLQAEE
jgi:hypothetical protein